MFDYRLGNAFSKDSIKTSRSSYVVFNLENPFHRHRFANQCQFGQLATKYHFASFPVRLLSKKDKFYNIIYNITAQYIFRNSLTWLNEHIFPMVGIFLQVLCQIQKSF